MPRSDDSAMVGAVIEWFSQEARDLPWRHADCSPWGVLVSEVMLQQTPVVRVEPVWREWMRRWPTPGDLAAEPQAEAVRAWGRLGYPRRAQRLWLCAAAIVDRHDGEVPQDTEALRALPGIGEYTAAAVRTFAFGERDVVLDTNVRRVIGRAWRAEPHPAAHLTRAEREAAAGLVPEDPLEAAAWNAGAMELGALVCVARAPLCERCPLERDCAWVGTGRPGLGVSTGRTQAWHGTDRQVRGRIMALLRSADGPVTIAGHAELEDVEPAQLMRCLRSLEGDGLAVASPAGHSL
ncbi:A/G-specific adenine glycosylase [Demequina activiva]|uniref:Adenine DNA glycosylase n=1 Tax=Demequina activiva TaxID=1582364 RepID=A0A919Q510_9MICO|nr:A/G-specific adenine glycosylase [Demequina activiva]GIG55011.1 adenine glycosylase [Demequina activiva]